MDLPPAVIAAARAAVDVARAQDGTACAALVGSWAVGRARPVSDVDLVLLVEDPEPLLTSEAWFDVFGPGATLVGQRDFGALQERRLRLPGDLVVEVAVGRLAWASTSPLDAGTHRVVADGLVPLLDPEGRLAHLLRTVTGRDAVPPRGARPPSHGAGGHRRVAQPDR